MQKLILSTLLLCILILLDYSYGKATFDLSDSITEYMQQQFDYGDENGLVESFLLIFYVLGGRQFMGLLFVILWLKSGLKEQVLKLITIYSITAFLGHFIKLILIQPRPFYEESDVRLDFCQKGYGDPSDNALRSIVFYVIVSETLLFKKYKVQANDLGVLSSINQDRKLQYLYKQLSNHDLYTQLYPNSMFSYNQYKFMLASFLFITGISNSYFGLNYLSQVIMGWVVGGYILYVYYYCEFEKQIERLFQQAIYNQQDQLNNKLRHIGKLALCLTFPLLISLLLYILRSNDDELIQLQQEWGQFFKGNSKCVNQFYRFNMSFEKQEMVGTCVLFLPFYLYLCCYFTPGQYKPEQYDHQTFTLKGFVRVLIQPKRILFLFIFIFKYRVNRRRQHKMNIFIILIQSTVLIGLLISQLAIHILIRQVVMSNDLDVNIIYLIMGQLFLELYFSLFLITLLPLLYKLCKVDIDGDFLRKINQIEMQEMEL